MDPMTKISIIALSISVGIVLFFLVPRFKCWITSTDDEEKIRKHLEFAGHKLSSKQEATKWQRFFWLSSRDYQICYTDSAGIEVDATCTVSDSEGISISSQS